MRLHVNCIYALMLISTCTLPAYSTRSGGSVGKRAIDLDDLNDPSSPPRVVIPGGAPVLNVRNSITKIQNLDIDDFPVGINGGGEHSAVSAFTSLYDGSHVDASRNSGGGDASNTSPTLPSAMSGKTDDQLDVSKSAVTKEQIDKILSFKMRQFKRPPLPRVRRAHKQRRYIHMPIGRGSYLGHLADATNDINLKMQNYAATMMVVLTTPRTTVAASMPHINGKLMEIKTLEPNDKHSPTASLKEHSTTNRAVYSSGVDEGLLRTFPNIFSTSTAATAAGATTTAAPVSKVVNLTHSTTHKTVQRNAKATTLVQPTPGRKAVDSTQVVHVDDDYPLLGADGFYSGGGGGGGGGGASPMKPHKRSPRVTPIYAAGVELARLSTGIKENRPMSETSMKQATPPMPQYGSSRGTPPAPPHSPWQRPTFASMSSRSDLSDASDGCASGPSSTQSSANTKKVNFAAAQVTITVTAMPPANQTTTQSDLLSSCGEKEQRTAQSTCEHTRVTAPKAASTSKPVTSTIATTATTSPYHWENDIIKELNLKFKKDAAESTGPSAGNSASTAGGGASSEAVAAASGETSTASSGSSERSSTASGGSSEGASAASGGSSEGTLTAVVTQQSGNTTKMPICKGKECVNLYNGFHIYNDTGEDCNKEPDDTGSGGYDIPEYVEQPTTLPSIHSCSNHTTAAPTTTAKACPPHGTHCNDEDDDDEGPESCNTPTKPLQGCPDKGYNKPKKKGKRQITVTSNFSAYSPSPSAAAPAADLQNLLSNLLATSGPVPLASSSPIPYPMMFGTPQSPYNAALLQSLNAFQPLPAAAATAAVPPPPTLPPDLQIFKKSAVDTSMLSCIIDNLKVVDQKLAEAVDPLHSAQEMLDAATRTDSVDCSSTVAPIGACGGYSSISVPSSNGGGAGGSIGDLSEVEKAALQKLALKIMCQPQCKLKRSDDVLLQVTAGVHPMATNTATIDPADSALFVKRGVRALAGGGSGGGGATFDYVEGDRRSRLQRDLDVAEELATIVAHIDEADDDGDDDAEEEPIRPERHVLGAHRRAPGKLSHGFSMTSDQNYDDLGGHADFKNFLYESGSAPSKRRSMASEVKARRTGGKAEAGGEVDGDNEIEYTHTKIKKTKQKSLWRKLFGLTSSKTDKNRFLDQDIPNFQLHGQKRMNF